MIRTEKARSEMKKLDFFEVTRLAFVAFCALCFCGGMAGTALLIWKEVLK